MTDFTYDDLNKAVRDAKRQLDRVDSVVGNLAEMCIGRLRSGNVRSGALAQLKRELTDFNLKTRKWKPR